MGKRGKKSKMRRKMTGRQKMKEKEKEKEEVAFITEPIKTLSM